jgi:hypothetical protein
MAGDLFAPGVFPEAAPEDSNFDTVHSASNHFCRKYGFHGIRNIQSSDLGF